MKQYKDIAFILRRTNFGEADSLVTVFSKHHGKLKLLAKGSRKIKSKFIGHIEPLAFIKFSAVSGKSFEILTGNQVEKSLHKLKEDFQNLPLMNLIAEILDFVTCEKLSNPKVFNLISKIFNSRLWKINPEFVVLFFLVNLLKSLGFEPSLDFCVKCNNENSKAYYFSYYWGGILCDDCRDSYPHKKIDKKIINVLRTIKKSSESQNAHDHFDEIDAALVKVNDRLLEKKALDFMSDFFIFINEKKPNSLLFLEGLSQGKFLDS